MVVKQVLYPKKEYVYLTEEWQQKENELKDKFPLWSHLTGVPVNKLNDLETVGNTLHIHQLRKAPMPDGLSSQDIKTLIATRDWIFTAREKPRQIAKAYSTQLMTNIFNYLNKASQDTTKLKYILLSAHDTTITRALSFLETPLDTPPPYASALNFSLYERGSNHFIVKITYNNQPVSIPACGGTICDLEQLEHLIKQ